MLYNSYMSCVFPLGLAITSFFFDSLYVPNANSFPEFSHRALELPVRSVKEFEFSVEDWSIS